MRIDLDGETQQHLQDDPEKEALQTNLMMQGQESKNLYLTEAIAYYNLGASYEHLGSIKLDDAVRSYEISLQIAKLHLPQGHPLSKTIQESLLKVQGRAKFN